VSLRRVGIIEASLPGPEAIPAAPAAAAHPLMGEKPKAIRWSTLPLRIGADSQGGTCLQAELTRVGVFTHARASEEIRQVADK